MIDITNRNCCPDTAFFYFHYGMFMHAFCKLGSTLKFTCIYSHTQFALFAKVRKKNTQPKVLRVNIKLYLQTKLIS